jgi:hypothetical protein
MEAITAVAVPLAFVCVVAAARRRSRRRRARGVTSAGVFRCRVRASGAGDGTRSWPRRSVNAHWVHDVLVLDWGLLIHRRRTLGVRTAFGVLDAVRTLTNDEGEVSLCLELDDGSAIRVATAEDAADALGGPFLCAHPTLRRTPPLV